MGSLLHLKRLPCLVNNQESFGQAASFKQTRECMNRIDKALQRQIDLNKTKNMLYDQLGQIIEIDPDFLAALEELLTSHEKAFSEQELQDTISSAARLLLKRLYAINQFLQIDEQKMRLLEGIYLRTWQRIVETKNVQATLKDYHYPELADWISSSYPQSFLEPLRSSPTIGHVICEEYSPQLQIELLKLDVHTLKQPLLDIGCGSTASLVRHLHTLRVDAHGIDRQIEKEETYLEQMDWLGYEFEPDTWGTIISNMAFTNHLIYAYHHDNTQLELYLRKFNEIIASLTIGGSFHYAPSVPFVEQRLKTNLYMIERLKIVKDISMTRVMRLAK
jgi:hypothetical protein